jgi:hypothetical protein
MTIKHHRLSAYTYDYSRRLLCYRLASSSANLYRYFHWARSFNDTRVGDLLLPLPLLHDDDDDDDDDDDGVKEDEEAGDEDVEEGSGISTANTISAA